MYISRLQVSNFKSFQSLDIELGKFNVLVGANASGKSNFVQIFSFLRDIAEHGLENAISLQGGADFLTNLRIGRSSELRIAVEVDKPGVPPFLLGNKIRKSGQPAIAIDTLFYEFALRFGASRSRPYTIEHDVIRLIGRVAEWNDLVSGAKRQGIQAEWQIVKRDGDISQHLVGRDGSSVDAKHPSILEEPPITPHTLLLEPDLVHLVFPHWMPFRELAIYDIDPRYSRESIKVTGRTQLERDGSNLAIVLSRLLQNKEQRRSLLNMVKDLLPFVSSLEAERFTDKSLLLNLEETYTGKRQLPAFLLSGGTVSALALIIALYFEQKQITIIEEPERNIHPHLMSRIVQMLKEASEQKQVLVTTHNPELIKHIDVEDILLVSRDVEGFSVVTRPGEAEMVQAFLADELGLDELLVANLLDA